MKSKNNENLDVSKEIYYFFDGSERHIKMYKESNIELGSYLNGINTVENASEGIISMKKYMNGETDTGNELNLIIMYNGSIRYISRKIKMMKPEDIYILINELEKEYKHERENLLSLLDKTIITSRTMLELENLKKLINIKNSIRNNVNIRSILFNFFEYLRV